jgi:hypothetical protein
MIFLREAFSRVIEAGVPVSYLAYLLLLPLLVSLVAAARHLLGVSTHGAFIPMIISLVWLRVGLVEGALVAIFLFFWGRLARTLIKKTMIRRFRIDYLPRMAILLLFITAGFLLLVLVGGFHWLLALEEDVFAWLILILIIHNLHEAQMTLSRKESRGLVLETLIFALAGYGLLSWAALQDLVLAYPILSLLFAFLFNIFVGRYTGFRLLEYRRFRPILKRE